MTMASKPPKGDPRTIQVQRGDEREWVTPEVAGVLERQGNGWERVGGSVSDIDKAVEKATANLQARVVELEGQLAAGGGGGMPEGAAELIDWIGDDRSRALQAYSPENDRSTPRTTVLEHLESVLNPQPPQED